MLSPFVSFFCWSHGQWEGFGCQGETWGPRERGRVREGGCHKMLMEIIKLPANSGDTFLVFAFECP